MIHTGARSVGLGAIRTGVILTIAAAVLAAGTVLAPSADAAQNHAAEQQFVHLINTERVAHGLRPLRVRQDIREVAFAWSATMAANQVLEHNPHYREQICCWLAVAENVGYRRHPGEPAEIKVAWLHEALMASPGHRANILNPRVTEVGVGVWHDGAWMWVTQNFRLPSGVVDSPSDGTTSPPASPVPQPSPTASPGSPASAESTTSAAVDPGRRQTELRAYFSARAEELARHEQLLDGLSAGTPHEVGLWVDLSGDYRMADTTVAHLRGEHVAEDDETGTTGADGPVASDIGVRAAAPAGASGLLLLVGLLYLRSSFCRSR